MATRVPVKNGNLDGALKRLRQKMNRDKLPSELKKREHYLKPGVRNRNAKEEGIKNTRKRERANNRAA